MKRVLALVAVPALAIALAACGDGDGSGHASPGHSMPAMSSGTGTQAGRHNDQDVMFAQMMIPHHRQAIDMAGLAATRASSPEVKKLAADIKSAQGPEIEKMTAWLKGWGASVPPPGSDGMEGMDHGDGMMSEKEMKELEDTDGRAFDKAFLEMMIEHHEGAVAMGRTEQASGQSPEAKQMADGIISSQSAEIAKMRDMLKKM